MSDKIKQPPKLPKLPTSALDTEKGLQAREQTWFEYPVKAQPHHTDYAGIVWHGTYLTWMEEARVEIFTLDWDRVCRFSVDGLRSTSGRTFSALSLTDSFRSLGNS